MYVVTSGVNGESRNHENTSYVKTMVNCIAA